MKESDKLIDVSVSKEAESLSTSGSSDFSWWLKIAVGSAVVMGGTIAAAYLLPAGVLVGTCATVLNIATGASGFSALASGYRTYKEYKAEKTEASEREKTIFVISQTLKLLEEKKQVAVSDSSGSAKELEVLRELHEKAASDILALRKQLDQCATEQKVERAEIEAIIKDQLEMMRDMQACLSRFGLFPEGPNDTLTSAEDDMQLRRRANFG